MDAHDGRVDFSGLPELGSIDLNTLCSNIPLTEIDYNAPLLEMYLERHDSWTEKVRLVGLDAGVLVDYRLVPGIDRLVDRLYGQCGWGRPDIFLVSDIGRKGIDGWSAVSVISDDTPVMLLGTHLVEALTPTELAHIIGHETGHLLEYSGEWRKQMSLAFLIREHIEGGRAEVLEQLGPSMDWAATYRTIMHNSRCQETRCDRLGLLLCGDLRAAASALLSVALRSATLARGMNLERYLSVQLPLLDRSPVLAPAVANAGHPFVPYRLQSMFDFVRSGEQTKFTRIFGRY